MRAREQFDGRPLNPKEFKRPKLWKYGYYKIEYIYVLHARGVFKLGRTVDPAQRIEALKEGPPPGYDPADPEWRLNLKFPDAALLPREAYEELRFLRMWRFKGPVAHKIERWFHLQLSAHCVGGEWFNCPLEAVDALLPTARQVEAELIVPIRKWAPWKGAPPFTIRMIRGVDY